MAKLPVLQQLSRQDFPDAPNWISKLLYPLQLFMTSVINALTSQLTYQDNFSAIINTHTFTAGSADTNNAYTFQCALGRQPIELTVHAVRTDGSYEVLYPQVSWNFINNTISINAIKGLTSGAQYTLTFVVK